MKTVDLTKEISAAEPAGLHYEKLSEAEGRLTRALWEQVFTEDTTSFLDYYYSEKTIGAHIHVLQDDNGQIVSMVHANPYDVLIHGVRRRAYYIVGVATAQPYRHRGCMAFLLRKAVCLAKSEGCPFVFLMPADAAIYEPFGFRYGGRLSVWERSTCLKIRMEQNMPSGSVSVRAAEWTRKGGDAADFTGLRISAYSAADAGALAAYAGKTLAERYDTYCVHDEAYFGRLGRELASENGGIYLVWRQEHEKDTLCGYFCYACEEQEYLQEVVVDREAEALFFEKNTEERIMFLPLEEACPYGRLYFPEIV